MIKNSLYIGDCLDVMTAIPDKSIDFILCDPPFQITNAKWDIMIPFDKMWEQYERIIKDNGCIAIFAAFPFDKMLACSNLKLFKYEWIWEKNQATGFLNAKKQPMRAHENILIFYKKQPIYNAQKTLGHKPINSYTKKASVQNRTELYGKVSLDISGGGETDRYPRSVLKFPSDKQKNKLNGTIHPTQKPLKLCEYLIATYTNEDDLVLDNAAGSGTTGLAAKNLNRDYIMIEKDPKWVDVVKLRIDDIILVSNQKG